MASRSGQFLKGKERDSLIQELKSVGELEVGKVPKDILDRAAELGNPPPAPSFGTGCLACGEDEDHANLLLCEICNAEYHTYCLSPPLRSVPMGDWFCAQCRVPSFQDDGLDKLVDALPPSITSRFGEVCWAQGGVGFGWWPAFVYDPRLTVGNARQLARKNLGKKHLIYFFECHDAPFAVLTDSKTMKWEDGLLDDHHLGKTAKTAGKSRAKLFQQSLQAATVEAGKPIEMRMDWNHTDQPQILPSPKIVKPKRKIKSRTENGPNDRSQENGDGHARKRIRGFDLLPESLKSTSFLPQVSTRRNLTQALEALAGTGGTNQIESPEDGDLYCTLLKKPDSLEGSTQCNLKSVGFLKLESRKTSTFADARSVIEEELIPDCIPSGTKWKFFVPSLGPVSKKQEVSLGSMRQFLRSTTLDTNLGKGDVRHPLKVVITFD